MNTDAVFFRFVRIATLDSLFELRGEGHLCMVQRTSASRPFWPQADLGAERGKGPGPPGLY